jgi:hypothetical protein
MVAMTLAESAMLRVRLEAARTIGALKDISELKYMLERSTMVIDMKDCEHNGLK